MSALVRSVKKVSAFAGMSARGRERFTRSFRVFLLGIVIACGVEVVMDWHSTLGEVRSLHTRVRERGRNYVAVLLSPLVGALSSKDAAPMERVVGGVFDDQDVVFVRVVGKDAAPVYERIEPDYAAAFQQDRGTPFADYYAHQLERDAKGIIDDPDGLRERMEHSWHRDVPQQYQDLLVSLHLAKAERIRARRDDVILFQDRLYTTNKKEHDPAVTYAIGRIDGADGKAVGAVIVAFDMRATNDAVRGKYLKGAGLVVFFVLLIVVQNLSGRREKLRLLDLESKYTRAKESIRDALPKPADVGGLRVAGAISQSVGSVDGMLWELEPLDGGLELLIVDPEGDGMEAAAVALHLRATYRQRREEKASASMTEELAALGAATCRIPGQRPVGVVLLRVSADGAIDGLRCGMGAPRLIAGEAVSPLEEADAKTDAPEGVVGPVRSLRGKLARGALLVIATDGLGGATRRVDPDGVAKFIARTRSRAADLKSLASDAATWARGTSAELLQDDIVVVAVESIA